MHTACQKGRLVVMPATYTGSMGYRSFVRAYMNFARCCSLSVLHFNPFFTLLSRCLVTYSWPNRSLRCLSQSSSIITAYARPILKPQTWTLLASHTTTHACNVRVCARGESTRNIRIGFEFFPTLIPIPWDSACPNSGLSVLQTDWCDTSKYCLAAAYLARPYIGTRRDR